MSEFFPIEYKHKLSRIAQLVERVPFRHSRYQLEHFVVCQKKLSVDMQYKQCLRELNFRHEVIVEKEFEYKDLLLKIESLELDVEKELSLEFCDEIAKKISANKIKQIKNQIELNEFRANKMRIDVLDILREMGILLELENSLKDKREYQDMEEGEDAYWRQIDVGFVLENKEGQEK